MPKVSLGAWLPDFGPLGNTGVVEAKNVLPHVQGYKPLKGPLNVKAPASLSGLFISGAYWCELAGRNLLFVGTQNTASATLARLFYADENTSGWTDKSQTTHSYSASPFWQFTRFGNLLIAVKGHGGGATLLPQKMTISTSAGANVFSNLGGSPVTTRAERVAVIRDFVVLGAPDSLYTTVRWSALGNAEDWTISATTQSDEQDIQAEGNITAIVGGEYGLIFFQHAIYRMNYIGPPVIFQFDKIADVGAFRGGVTKLNDNVYFLGPQGFGVVRGGFEASIISSDSIDHYIRDNVNLDVPGVERAFPVLASDPRDRIVAISYMDRATTVGSADKRTQMLFYDESLDRFSRASLTHQWIFNALIRPLNAGYGYSVSILHMMAMFDKNNNLSVLDGDTLRALIETGEGQLNENGRTFVNKVIPFVNGVTAPMVQVGVRERQHQTVSFGATVTANTKNGVANVRVAGKFHRLRIHMSQSASWSLMTGFEVDGRPDGVR